MFIYHSTTLDPHFNIATEELLFKKKNRNFFLIYRNNPSVILGKHQNAFAEANSKIAFTEKIPVVRRLSGGGTVYHDAGNINFSFIINRQGKNIVDFKKHIQPIFELLKDIGINVEYSKRNDLFIGKKKISGNAEHVVRNRVLHHGTLLFSSDLLKLNNLLKVKNELFKGKAISSVRSTVGNISDHLDQKIAIEELINLIIEKISTNNPNSEKYYLTKDDMLGIENLVNTKYKTWEWNYAYSPAFNFENKTITASGMLKCRLFIKKGLIEEIDFTSDFITNEELNKIRTDLQGEPFKYDRIYDVFRLLSIEYENVFMDLLFPS